MKPYKVFLASPGDVVDLRRATISIFKKEFNDVAARDGQIIFNLYAWEESKKPGYTKNYQQDIFSEFGDHCDIFICLLWHKYGKGTGDEYKKAVETFLVKNPQMKLWICRYARPVDPTKIDPKQLAALNKFVLEEQDKWAPLGGVRGAIKNKASYEQVLRQEINDFLRNEKKRLPTSPAYDFFKLLGET